MYSDNLKDIDEIIHYLIENYKSPLISKVVNNSITVYSGYKGRVLKIRLSVVDKVWGFDVFIVDMKIAKYERYFTWVQNKPCRFYINKSGLGNLKGKLMPLDVEDFYR